MKLLLYFFFVLFHTTSSKAAFSNPSALALGDRSSGMGGASTALTGDVSSAAYYNPALLARSPGQSFSASASVYKKFDTIYGGDADYTKTPLRISTGYFRSIPASTGNILTWNDFKVGLSIVVPDYDSFKGDLKNTTTNSTTLSYTDESLWVGGAISRNIDNFSSWGVTMYYTARNFNRSIQDKSYSGGNLAYLFTSEETIQQNSIIATFGYYYRFNPSWALGVSLRAPALPFHSGASYFEDEFNGATSVSRVSQSDLSADSFIPARLATGLAWGNSDGLTVTADVVYFDGREIRSFDYQDKGSRLNYQPVVNYAIGLEQRFWDWFRLRAGLFSSFSAHPNPDPQYSRLQGERVDQAGFSANLNFISGKKVSYTFGGYWTGGRGQAMVRTEQQYQVQPKVQNIFTMLVGTSFFF